MNVLLLVVFLFFSSIAGQPSTSDSSAFIPADNFLLNCGATTPATASDGRIFLPDAPFFSSAAAATAATATSGGPSRVFLSARIFPSEATYTFKLTRAGWHWLRLHFLPFQAPSLDLNSAVFSVATADLVLLHSFSAQDFTSREFLLNATAPLLSLRFSPQRNSLAFVNAIELVSAPGSLFSAAATGGATALQTAHRVNVGGPAVNDSLGRAWADDEGLLQSRSAAQRVSVRPAAVSFPNGGAARLAAPPWVYATAQKMADDRVGRRNFNITWLLNVDPSFGYLVRLHFCDIVSKSLNSLYFNVYLNERVAVAALDLSTAAGELAGAFYRDFLLNASSAGDRITVQVGPAEDGGSADAILNGIEVMKISNSVGSLDGEFGVNGNSVSTSSPSTGTMAALRIAMMFGAFAGMGAVAMRWNKRPGNWESRKSFSSWLLPLHNNGASATFTSGKGSVSFSSSIGLGRYFSLHELNEATKGFSKENIIGVGGFGEVFLGHLEDGETVAVKRGNPQSQQGINEFQTEIQILSKLRHRHLVSLIGYCDQGSEMILVYEFMAKGPLRDHLYGKGLPALSWKQRLEICIGAARGLHYLHTGAAQGIIHRDVKSTNILLDEELVAKVSDFGLSKDAPAAGGAVSTAVKGSFGYLDPEYFRRQRLTEKSDVYSFGVLMLEVVCARPALCPALPREQVSLAEWAIQCKKKGQLEKIVDSAIAGTAGKESLNKFVEAAEKCLAEHGVDRPTMGDVLWNLEHALQLQSASDGGVVGGSPGSLE
ncbi:putative receptor-like protein kinase At4g39110 [Wolffia australiana]